MCHGNPEHRHRASGYAVPMSKDPPTNDLRDRLEQAIAALIERESTGDEDAVPRATALLGSLTDLAAPRPAPPASDPATCAAFHDLLGEWARAREGHALAAWSFTELVRLEQHSGAEPLNLAFSWQKLANARASLGDAPGCDAAHAEAVALLDRAQAEPGFRAQVWFDHATTLCAHHRWAESLTAFDLARAALERDAADDEVRGVVEVHRAVALAGAGRVADAEAAMARGEKLRGWIDIDLHAAMDAAAQVGRG